MDFKDKIVVVTGGGSGIGAELCMRLAAEGAKVVVTDIAADAANKVADEIGATAKSCDVTNEDDIKRVVADVTRDIGPIDMFCSNAGLGFGEPDHAASASNDVWQTCFNVHVMAQVYAARAVLPDMIARGEGYLVNMASAAGLLSQIGDAAYSATKHASVAFSESLAITHGKEGVKVSVICPQYVATPLTGYEKDAAPRSEGVITVQKAVDAIMEGLRSEQFMILTHPEVDELAKRRVLDKDRWLGGMRKLRQNIIEQAGSTRLEDIVKVF